MNRYRQLGTSDLQVSTITLGSMTWGLQNNQTDADDQIQYALQQGINFIDTAEMYPVPPDASRAGDTERILGNWLSRNSNQRSNLIIASKIAGPGVPYIRQGSPISAATIYEAIDNSLARLQTEYIDLYQLHWPNRRHPHFGNHAPNDLAIDNINAAVQLEQMHEILSALADCIAAGKIRHIGLSDDTCWGISSYLKLADKFNLPKIVSIQNECNLLHSKDWPYLIEQCLLDDVAYLPWSPLAGGMLSGKYLNGARPEGSRWTRSQRNGLFRDTPLSEAAISKYVTLANEFGMTPSQLALAWVNHLKGVTSTIIGATTMAQLKENIEAFDISFTSEQWAAIQSVWQQYPVPF